MELYVPHTIVREEVRERNQTIDIRLQAHTFLMFQCKDNIINHISKKAATYCMLKNKIKK